MGIEILAAALLTGAILGLACAALVLGLRPAPARFWRLCVGGRLLSGSRIVEARGFARRLVGLLNHACLAEGEGLLLRNTRAIHTHGMAFSIDVIFLDSSDRVVQWRCFVPPGHVVRGPRAARHTLELAYGAVDRLGLALGERLEWFEATQEGAPGLK